MRLLRDQGKLPAAEEQVAVRTESFTAFQSVS
jgi:hypothetical protein